MDGDDKEDPSPGSGSEAETEDVQNGRTSAAHQYQQYMSSLLHQAALVQQSSMGAAAAAAGLFHHPAFPMTMYPMLGFPSVPVPAYMMGTGMGLNMLLGGKKDGNAVDLSDLVKKGTQSSSLPILAPGSELAELASGFGGLGLPRSLPGLPQSQLAFNSAAKVEKKLKKKRKHKSVTVAKSEVERLGKGLLTAGLMENELSRKQNQVTPTVSNNDEIALDMTKKKSPLVRYCFGFLV